jgi:carbon monoxide dehydrogenase subunit G
MLTIESKTGTATGSPEQVFAYITDFTHFASLLPAERLTDLEVQPGRIAFEIQGLGRIGLEIREKIPYSTVVVGASKDSSADFNFTVHLTEATAGTAQVCIVLTANLNIFLEMMARGPLQQLADLMVDKLGAVDFSSGQGA